MNALNHSSYDVFSMDMNFFNVREIMVQELFKEMTAKKIEIGKLLDDQGISRQVLPELYNVHISTRRKIISSRIPLDV